MALKFHDVGPCFGEGYKYTVATCPRDESHVSHDWCARREVSVRSPMLHCGGTR